MKISSKSILSPGRAGARDPLTTLSTSLSRRLRNSGSVKGGASPAMFPTTTTVKKRSNFENPEPSSPKVTCIGQVRVRSKKKQAKKFTTLSRKHSSGAGAGAGEISFRNIEHPLNGFPSKRHKIKESSNLGSHGSQNDHQRKWVHFPVTVCDALRAFGSEFTCLFPCRTERGGKRDIEFIAEDEEQEQDDEEEESYWKSRRHVFEDLQIVNDRIEGGKDEARVSICVPPKNALLLMRCRSDPMKVEALVNRSWEPSVEKTDEKDELFDIEDQVEGNLEVGQKKVVILNQNQDNMQKYEMGQDQDHQNMQKYEVGQDQDHHNMLKYEVGQAQDHHNMLKCEVGQDQDHDNMQKYEVGQDQDYVKVQKDEESFNLVSLFEEPMNQDYEIQETHKQEHINGVLERESEVKESENMLPECLLMMLYEPKLSMEVSKETWVCRKDFIRRQSSKKKPPPAPAIKPDGGDESSVGTNVTDNINEVMRVDDGGFPAVLRQPARSSCSFPVAPSMAMVVEQKLANAVGYEPFVLTRCKSEPMKTAAAKLLQESCVLENRKLDLERLSRVGFGVGSAGVGF